MDIRTAMKQQYHAGLGMLADCVSKCPGDLWVSGEYPRYFWRIAMHAAFFAQIGLGQDEAAYQPWTGSKAFAALKLDPAYREPYEMEDGIEPLSRAAVLESIGFVDSLVDPMLDSLDLDTEESGFRWYEGFPKLGHELMSIGHVQYHVGQLAELLMARGIDIEWRSKGD